MTINRLGAVLHQIKHLFAEGTATGLSDAQLLDRFLADRDGAAFEVLMRGMDPWS